MSELSKEDLIKLLLEFSAEYEAIMASENDDNYDEEMAILARDMVKIIPHILNHLNS